MSSTTRLTSRISAIMREASSVSAPHGELTALHVSLDERNGLPRRPQGVVQAPDLDRDRSVRRLGAVARDGEAGHRVDGARRRDRASQRRHKPRAWIGSMRDGVDRIFALRLLAIATAGLALRVLCTVVIDPSQRGIGDFYYDHDLAVAAVCAVAGACLLNARNRRRSTAEESAPP